MVPWTRSVSRLRDDRRVRRRLVPNANVGARRENGIEQPGIRGRLVLAAGQVPFRPDARSAVRAAYLVQQVVFVDEVKPDLWAPRATCQ